MKDLRKYLSMIWFTHKKGLKSRRFKLYKFNLKGKKLRTFIRLLLVFSKEINFLGLIRRGDFKFKFLFGSLYKLALEKGLGLS